MQSYTESTTSRPLAPHPPVAAPQDLVKLGKVQKAKRLRTNKAKQGRPSHLSVSQKRKLVRLYIHTNLPLEAIRKLVEHFGTTQIQTRALQYILRSFLLDRYNKLRPGSVEASQKRTFQIRLCKTFRSPRHNIQESFELESPSPYPVVKFDTNTPGQSVMDMNGIAAEELIEIWTPENSSETHNSADHMESSDHSSLDRGLGSASSTLTAEIRCVWTPHNVQELPLSSDQLFAPVQPVLISPHDPFMGVTGNESLDHLLSRRKEIEAGITELDLVNDDDGSTAGLGSQFGTNNTDESSLIPLAAQPLEMLTTTWASRWSPKSSQSDKESMDTSKDIRIPFRDPGRKQSELKILITRSTKTSSETRTMIEDLLTTLTASTASTASTSDQQSILPPRNTLPPRNIIPSRREYYSAGARRGPGRLARRYFWQSNTRLPGNQVEFSNGLELWSHRPLYCSNCLSMNQCHFWEFWCNENIGWSDEYGNTSLHVAAALGACPNILVQVIRYGVDVNRTNTAGQNFLHVLPESDRSVSGEYIILVNELNIRGFNFEHRDAWHQTVLDVGHESYRKLKADLRRAFFAYGIRIDSVEREESLIVHVHASSSSDTIKELLNEGANINQRDSMGQTPLHASIKVGRTLITSTLLGFQPNLHARDIRGKGVLAVGKSALRLAKSDPSLYAKITACMTLAIDAGAIAEPTSYHEWRLPNYQYWQGDPTQLEETLHGS